MRWLFLLLVILNVFYYIWHQQDAPIRVKEITSLSLYKGSQQDIHLLSESRSVLATRASVAEGTDVDGCLYLGGFSSKADMRRVQGRLAEVNAQADEVRIESGILAGDALKVASGDEQKLDVAFLQTLINEFNELKYKTMRCKGLQEPFGLNRMAPALQ